MYITLGERNNDLGIAEFSINRESQVTLDILYKERVNNPKIHLKIQG